MFEHFPTDSRTLPEVKSQFSHITDQMGQIAKPSPLPEWDLVFCELFI